MFTLQKYSYITEITTFQSFDTLADALTDVRSNQGLNEGQFLEFMFNRAVYERPEIFMCIFEGEIPTSAEAKARIPKR